MTIQERLEAAFQEDSTIGRKRLVKLTGCGHGTAQRFLERKRGKVKPPDTPLPPIPSTKESQLVIENRSLRHQLHSQTEEITRLTAAYDLLKDISSAQLHPPKWLITSSGKTHRAIATAPLSDTHYDEVVRPSEMGGVNAYNREIAQLRTRLFFRNVVRLGKDIFSGIRMEGLVMPLLGDLVSGEIHEELAQTNAAQILDTCLFWSEELAAGIETVAKAYDKVFLPCVVGNHGRQSRKPRAKGRVKDSFDYLIYALLARHFRHSDRVTFAIPETADAHYSIYQTKYVATHGDQFRGGTGIAGALSPLLLGDARKRKRSNALNQPYDYMVAGHWHQELDTMGIIINNTMKGYDEYAMVSNLPFSEPSQSFWLTDPDKGRTLRAPIHVRSREEDWTAANEAQQPAWLA